MQRLCFLLLISMLLCSCGRKGALIYPEQLLPESPKAVTLQQTGLTMKLSFHIPSKDLTGRPLTGLGGIKVLKHEATFEQGAACDACADAFRTFRIIYADVQGDSIRRYGNIIIMLDPDVKIGYRYSYVLVPFTKEAVDGQKSEAIKAAMLQPPQPPNLKAIPAPTEIILQFSGDIPVTGAFEGFNLFRAIKGEALPLIPLNKEPLPGNSYIDSGLDRRQTYSYSARMVVRMQTGELVESALSNQVEAALKNDDQVTD